VVHIINCNPKNIIYAEMILAQSTPATSRFFAPCAVDTRRYTETADIGEMKEG
jgi:hypothetical protein